MSICNTSYQQLLKGYTKEYRITIRWKRPGIRRDLSVKLYDGSAGMTGDDPLPGASAQSRYAELLIKEGGMMSEQETCFACQKHKGLEFVPGGPVYEDEIVFSGHSWSSEDQATPYLGGFIVEPKRHLPTWAELNDEEAETLGKVIRDVSRALKKSLDAEHIYVFVLGHHVPHLHVWVVPRYPDTPREYWGIDVFDWPDRPVGGQIVVEELCKRVRSFM